MRAQGNGSRAASGVAAKPSAVCLAAVIMASGFSRRMEENKLLMMYQGKPLAARVMDHVKTACFFKTVAVVAEDAVGRLAEERKIIVVYNDCPGQGQSRSVMLGTQACMDAEGIMFIPADMPFLTPQVLRQLQAAFNLYPDRIIRPLYLPVPMPAEGLPPLNPERPQKWIPGSPVIFPRCLFGELCALRGDTGGREVLRRHPKLVQTVKIKDALAGIDIDTPRDAIRWLK